MNGFHPLGEPGEELGGTGAEQTLRTAEVEKRFVDGQRFDQRRQPPHFGAHLTPDCAIFRHVRPYHNRIPAGGERSEHGHRRAHTVEPRHIAARQHDAASTAADDDRAVGQFGSVAFFDRRIERVAIDMRDRQRTKFGMADQSRRAASVAPLSPERSSSEGAAITAQRFHAASSGGHNQAAPRTPLDAP